MSDNLSLGGGPYHFFDSNSFKAASVSMRRARWFGLRTQPESMMRHTAPPEHRFRVYTAGQKRRVTAQIKRECSSAAPPSSR
jgi:hypothetical protein